MPMTGLTGPLVKVPPWFFVIKMRWRIGEIFWLIICKILAVRLIEKSDGELLSLFLIMVNCIVKPRMIICF
jgi:hypothetical protein